MNEDFAVPDFDEPEQTALWWLIALEQKHPPDVPKYFTGVVGERWLGGITAQAKNALRFSTKEGAEQRLTTVPPHPWGKWAAVEHGVAA